MKNKKIKKKHRQPKEHRPSMKAGWLSLLGVISALFIGAWVWMRRQSTPTVDTTAQLDTTAKTDPADSITYTGDPLYEFNHNEFNPTEFA